MSANGFVSFDNVAWYFYTFIVTLYLTVFKPCTVNSWYLCFILGVAKGVSIMAKS